MRRLSAAIASLALGVAPASADGVGTSPVVNFNGSNTRVINAAPLASSGVRKPDFFAALDAMVPGASMFARTNAPDCLGGPICREIRDGAFVEPGDALVTWLQGVPLSIPATGPGSIAQAFANAGGVVTGNGNPVQLVIPTPGQIGAPALAANLADLPSASAARSNIGAAAASVTTSDAGAVARAVPSKLGDMVSVLDFAGVDPSGLLDSTAGIQAGATALCARTAGAGTIYFPAGRYAINASVGVVLPCNLGIVGSSWGNPSTTNRGTNIIVIGSGSAPIFKFAGTPDSTRLYAFGGFLRDMSFTFQNVRNNPTQTGPAVYFAQCWMCEVHNVFASKPYRFLVGYAGNNVIASHIAVDDLAKQGEAFLFQGSDAGCGSGPCQSRMDVAQMDDVTVKVWSDGLATGLSNGTCVHVQDYVATVRMTKTGCNQVSVGLKVDCPTSTLAANCPGFVIGKIEVEANGNEGAKDSTGTAEAYAVLATDFEHLDLMGSYLCGCNADGSAASLRNVVKAVTSRFNRAGPVLLSGARINGSREAAVVVNSGQFEMIGGLVYGANQAAYPSTSGSTDERAFGIALESNPVGTAFGSRDKIQGVTFCFYQGAASAGMWPVIIGGTVAKSIVANNIISDCAGGVFNNNTGGGNVTTPNN